MKVTEHIAKAKSPLFSYEIVPPPRGRSVQEIISVVETLAPFHPSWIDVTSHSSTTHYHEKSDGTIQKKTLRKRPGTMGICGIIQNRFKVDTVAHILCQGFTREETEDALIELGFLGIENVLALRGDVPNFLKTPRNDRTINEFTADLIHQVVNMNEGKFLDEINVSACLNFCIGVAGYPEKHFEAPSLKADILNLKKKVDAGAEYIITQMFFDNKKYFEFVKQCRDVGIEVPIIPGLKIIKNISQLNSIPRNFYCDFPDQFIEEVQCNPKEVVEIGIRWAQKQVQGLLEYGVPGVHFFVTNNAESVVEVVKGYRK